MLEIPAKLDEFSGIRTVCILKSHLNLLISGDFVSNKVSLGKTPPSYGVPFKAALPEAS